MRVAVIGTGIAGNAAAWALSKRYPVTVYDRDIRPGGHSHTVTIDYDGAQLAVDIGFIVYNELNYPDLTALFDHLRVETVESCMSFAVSADAGRFEWKGGGDNWRETAQGLFAQPRNLLSPTYLWMLRDILTFNRKSVEDHAAGRLAGLSLGEYFGMRKFAPRLLTDYLAPMGAAIWSAPATEMLDFPAENFVAFFSNHRLLQYDRPVWRTVKGGSRRYVDKLTFAFRDRIQLGCAVTSIERTPFADHSKRDRSALRSYAQSCAAEHGVDLTGGRVLLLCYPRLLGFTFSPLSVYFCYRADGELALMIYEVRNTFGDIHAYVLPVQPGEVSDAGVRQQQEKLL